MLHCLLSHSEHTGTHVAFTAAVTPRLLHTYVSLPPATSRKVPLLPGCLVPFFSFPLPSRPLPSFVVVFFPPSPPPHKSPCRLSYLLMMFLQRPSSFLMSATSWRRAAFSRSRKAARTEIWFSLSRRASLERFAASLFLTRRLQYFSSCHWRRCCMLGCVMGSCGEERDKWRAE